VEVQVFTLAFRKVNELSFPQVRAGASVTIPLSDRWGTPLASGLYYTVVATNGKRTVLKLLVIR
jgi:hypothetical protein